MKKRLIRFNEKYIFDFESEIPLKITGSKFRGMLYSWNACTCRHCSGKEWRFKTWKKYRKFQYRII